MSALLEYYQNREGKETARAEACAHLGARRHHFELATLFRERRMLIEAEIRWWNDAMAQIERIVAAIAESEDNRL